MKLTQAMLWWVQGRSNGFGAAVRGFCRVAFRPLGLTLFGAPVYISWGSVITALLIGIAIGMLL